MNRWNKARIYSNSKWRKNQRKRLFNELITYYAEEIKVALEMAALQGETSESFDSDEEVPLPYLVAKKMPKSFGYKALD